MTGSYFAELNELFLIKEEFDLAVCLFCENLSTCFEMLVQNKKTLSSRQILVYMKFPDTDKNNGIARTSKEQS